MNFLGVTVGSLVLEIDYHGIQGRGTKSMAIKKKAQKERMYMIFAILTFCGRGAKNDF